MHVSQRDCVSKPGVAAQRYPGWSIATRPYPVGVSLTRARVGAARQKRKEEFLAFLERHEVEYDGRFIWE